MPRTDKLARASKTVAQFCADYHITRRTFEHWIARGIGPTILQPGGFRGRIVITAEAEEAWKRAHTAISAAIDTAE
jgi:hypothetical protein